MSIDKLGLCWVFGFVTMVGIVGCGGDAPQPPAGPILDPIDPTRITALALNDTTTRFPIQYGHTANYTIVMGDRGSFERYQHNTRPTISYAPNQPYLETPGDTFLISGTPRFDLGVFSIPSTLLFLEDSEELSYGPLLTSSGLRVWRKVWIPVDDDLVRYLEVVHNPTASPLTVRLRITSPTAGAFLLDDNDDGALSSSDRYFATFHPAAGAVAILIDGAGRDRLDDVEGSPDETEFAWHDVAVGAGEMVIYAHYVRLSPDDDPAPLRTALTALLGEGCWPGLTRAEAASIQNFRVAPCPSLVGTAGAAPPGNLFIENTRTGASVTTTVAGDGAFEAVLDAADGTEVLLRAANGAEAQIMVVGR